MSHATDVQISGTRLYYLPVTLRVPLKFGNETLTHLLCARVSLQVRDTAGRTAEGWGETPLSVQWAWPSSASHQQRLDTLQRFCGLLAKNWATFPGRGHPLEIGHDFQVHELPRLLNEFNENIGPATETMPWLAALICCSPFDIALHDAYGRLHGRSTYETYAPPFMNRDLADFLIAEPDGRNFAGRYPADDLVPNPPKRLPVWHLVGGLDPLDVSELTGREPDDGFPIILTDWIERDGLTCLKIKLGGTNQEWDYQRLVRVGELAMQNGVRRLSADFNCMVHEPAYVNEILDRLAKEHPAIFDLLLYVEQPFPYDLEAHPIDVHGVSARKPLYMDESAHDWQLIRLGRQRGWTGVALKTCKTQTQAILSACWAKAHGMGLMVQDLTNVMLAQIPHVLLASHVGTIAGVESNAPQFCPTASIPEEHIHPGLYRRRQGMLNLSSIHGAGFGYRLEEIERELPLPAAQFIS